MVLHTNKTRLELMQEEEEENDLEGRFQGELGTHLISYNSASLPRILGIFSGDYNRDFLLAFGLVMGCPLIDRTGTLAVTKYDFQEVGSSAAIMTEKKLNVINLYPVPPYQGQELKSMFNVTEDIHRHVVHVQRTVDYIELAVCLQV